LNQTLADISVIIPAYNRAGLIGETLRSLSNQTVPAKEIIIVDDGSTDGSADVVEREFSVLRNQFSENSKSNTPTFKILRQANAGPRAARNRAKRVARCGECASGDQ
jgi:glycosyltransferase involved in cell wall biosynthesis